MNTGYKIVIGLLAGAAVGLLAFLFIQPANTAKTTDNQPSQKQEIKQASSDYTETTSQDSRTDSENATDQTKNTSSTKEKWDGDVSSSTAIPKLIFYYKPGWPLCQSTKDIVDDLRTKYVGDIKIEYIPKRSERGIEGRRKYNIEHGMVLLDKEGDVFWKEEGLKFRRAKMKSKFDEILNND